MATFMEISSINPKLKQSEKTKDLGCSSSTLQWHRHNMNMFSPYRTSQSNTTHKTKQKSSNDSDHDLKTISNDLEMISKKDKPVSEKIKTKNNFKGVDPNDNYNQRKNIIEQAF